MDHNVKSTGRVSRAPTAVMRLLKQINQLVTKDNFGMPQIQHSFPKNSILISCVNSVRFQSNWPKFKLFAWTLLKW